MVFYWGALCIIYTEKATCLSNRKSGSSTVLANDVIWQNRPYGVSRRRQIDKQGIGMMTFHLMSESIMFQIIAFALHNDGVCAHYRWWLTVRCRPNDIALLQQWGRVTVSNAFGARHWHGVITEQTDYGIWQGWHYRQIGLASPLAMLAWWIGNRTWVGQPAVTVIRQLCRQAGWREGIHFAITSHSGRRILPLTMPTPRPS
jgi:hypothetical protein